MKKQFGIILIAVSLLFPACDRTEGPEADTATIEPATPPIETSIDDDPALTQTVEIGEERSPNEGGVLTRPEAEEPPETPAESPGGTSPR